VSPARTHADSRATKIARVVASRYEAAPTYSELLAAETARAEALAAEQRRAQQAKEAAALEAAGNLFQNLDVEETDQPSPTNSAETAASGARPADGEQAFLQRYGSAIVTQSMQSTSMQSATPGTAVMPQFAARTREMRLHQAQPEPEPSLEDLLASSLVESRALLPSKLIEFPRELVSSRRARPRLPEEPTLEQAPSLGEQPAQLRIFEVQPQIEAQPEDAAMLAELKANAEPAVSAERIADKGTAASAQMSMAETAPEMASGIAKEGVIGPAVKPTAPQSPREPIREQTGDGSAQRFTAAATQPHLAGNASSSSTATSNAARVGGSTSSASTTTNFRGLEWASISLDKEPAAYSRRAQTPAAEYMPFMVDPASIDRRVMAFAVDFAAVTAGFMAFLVVFVASTPHLPHGLTAAALAGAVYVALWVLYQMLFFSLSGATAGMLYAHIALCTFDDQNPTRSALQRRLIAWWTSFLPLTALPAPTSANTERVLSRCQHRCSLKRDRC
jgi:hypothetical protein